MARYICIDRCVHGRLYRLGDIAEFDNDFPKDEKGNLVYFRKIDGRKKDEIPDGTGDSGITVKVNQKERKVV